MKQNNLQEYFKNNTHLSLAGKALRKDTGETVLWAQIREHDFTFIYLNPKQRWFDNHNRCNGQIISYESSWSGTHFGELTVFDITKFFKLEDLVHFEIVAVKDWVMP